MTQYSPYFDDPVIPGKKHAVIMVDGRHDIEPVEWRGKLSYFPSYSRNGKVWKSYTRPEGGKVRFDTEQEAREYIASQPF